MSPEKRPNILIVMADQHRQDCLGIYGNSCVRTPNIDRLGSQGMVYDNCFCSYPVCTPSRYSILSGLYSRQHRGCSNHSTLSPDISTFPKLLKQKGYKTTAVGKMHFTPTYLDTGFEKMILAEQNGPGRYEDDYHKELMEAGLFDKNDLQEEVPEFRSKAPVEYWESLNAKVTNLPEEYHSTSWIGRKACEELTSWTEEGNLMMVSFIKPHHPFDPVKRWAETYSPEDLSQLPGWEENCSGEDLRRNRGFFPHDSWDEKTFRKVLAYYYANITHIDEEIGKMMTLLKEKEVFDDTIIIYTSDHGDYMGFHHLLLKSNYMYDPLMRIPMIIKPAGKTTGARRIDSLISNVDFPEILMNLLSGEKPCDPHIEREYVYAIGDGDSEYMIRNRRYKLLLCEDDSLSRFFDLKMDPFESKNLYRNNEYDQIIVEMKMNLLKWILFSCKTVPSCDELSKTTGNKNDPLSKMDKRNLTQAYFKSRMLKDEKKRTSEPD